MLRLNKNIVIFIITFIFLVGCSNPTQKLEISGQILDIDTKKPIPFVEVSFSKLKSGFPMGSWVIFEKVVAGEDGYFNIVIQVNDDIELVTDSNISSPGVTLQYNQYQGKRKANILIYGSLELKGMKGDEYKLVYED